MDTQRSQEDVRVMNKYSDTEYVQPNYVSPLNAGGMLQNAASNLLIDLPLLWAVFRRRLGLFIGGLLTVLLLVVLVTFQMTPLYQAEALVKLNTNEMNVSGLEGMIPGFSGDSSLVDTEVELISSRRLAERVTEKMDLYDDPEFNTSLKPPSNLGKVKNFLTSLFPSQVDQQLDEAAQLQIMQEKTVDRVMGRLQAERVGLTYIISVRFESEEPEKASKIANMFAELYLFQQVDAKFDELERNQRLFGERLATLQEEVRAADAKVEAFREANGIFVSDGSTLTEQRISDIQAQLIVARTELAESEAKYSSVNSQLENGDSVDSIAEVLQSPVISELRAKQADLSRRRSELSTRYGPKHPKMAEIDTEEANLFAQIDLEVRRIVSNLASEASISRKKVATLETSLAVARQELSSNSKAMVELGVLEREADAARTIYEQILGGSKTNLEIQAQTEADGEIASSAPIPTKAAFPNKLLNIALGFVLGAGFGALLVVLAEIFDNGLRTAEDIERSLHVPMLTAVPSLTKGILAGKDASLKPETYLVERPLSSFAEAYRTIRSNLLIGQDGRARPKVVALTSALSGEGKTSSALCLGRISAISGDKVIVVDCDIRRHILSNSVDKIDKGLLEVLAGETALRDAIRKDTKTDLHILPCTGSDNVPSDVFGSNSFDALINKLKTQYDMIILDTAPITAVADTRTVVSDADAAILIVRWRNTPMKIAHSAMKILEKLPTPILGAVLTQVDARSQTQYGYEGSEKYYREHQRYYHN
ncbi:MAG: GumC family protein [bacterium]